MIKVVVDGGPGTGKTSIIKELKKRGYPVAPEAARIILHRSKHRGKNLSKAQLKDIQKKIWNLSILEYRSAVKESKHHVLFFDRGVFSSLSYLILAKIQIPRFMIKQAELVIYDSIFISHPLPKRFYMNDNVRKEDYTTSIKIHKKIIHSYKK